MKKTEALLWVDIETTGTDPCTDQILEIGLRCTSLDTSEEYARYESIVKPDSLPTGREFGYAFNLHAANGLLAEVIAASPATHSTQRIACEVLAFVTSQAETHVLHPAGTNLVGFDLRFIELIFDNAALELFHNSLSYRALDMTSFRLMEKSLGADPYAAHKGPKPHRVHDCLDTDIDDYRLFRESIR
ncbi:hypothetical protein [Bifidobacterium scaligerum]|uniref:Uncharacterized protein n=1 Tax=Bifidobacterium scaligerum TaxID=2052656 RepID=A0A2M9HT40_9BIFI|nr:hypothetical protein [Bifidobacterium scaligerum]PJM79983.1 hypothetical protein CUU80_02285 [Bifidobacterium scaligerum]